MGKQERAQQKLNQQNNTDSLIQIPNICLFFSVYLSSPTKNPKPNNLLRATTFSLRILPLFYPQTITTPRQSPWQHDCNNTCTFYQLSLASRIIIKQERV